MAFVVLPAGESLRTVALRLGLPLNELRAKAGVDDVDTPLVKEQRIDVPEDFWKSRPGKRHVQSALTADTKKKSGMNAFLALDIEQKRTRAAGGMKSHPATPAEEEALGEAARAYGRFEADSNELAFDLYNQAATTHSTDVRARAFAGMGMAQAQRTLLFGEPFAPLQPQAISLAKAALWADPKLPEAHLAMALALMMAGRRKDDHEALTELETTLSQHPEHAGTWACLGRVCERLGELDAAQQATKQSLSLEASQPFALECHASLLARAGHPNEALAALETVIATIPTYANPWVLKAVLLRQAQQTDAANKALSQALELALRAPHRDLLRILMEQSLFPFLPLRD